MESRIRNAAVISIGAALCAYHWLTGLGDPRAPDQATLTSFIGTWTDENGPPGNYVRFAQVPRPSQIPGVQLLEGQGRIHGILDENDSSVLWNFESHTPLRLNVIIGNRTMVVPVRRVDSEHLQLRFVPTANVEAWSTNEVWNSPEVMRLTRIKDAAEEP